MDGFRENCSLNLKVTVAFTNTLKKKEKKKHSSARLFYKPYIYTEIYQKK